MLHETLGGLESVRKVRKLISVQKEVKEGKRDAA